MCDCDLCKLSKRINAVKNELIEDNNWYASEAISIITELWDCLMEKQMKLHEDSRIEEANKAFIEANNQNIKEVSLDFLTNLSSFKITKSPYEPRQSNR